MKKTFVILSACALSIATITTAYGECTKRSVVTETVYDYIYASSEIDTLSLTNLEPVDIDEATGQQRYTYEFMMAGNFNNDFHDTIGSFTMYYIDEGDPVGNLDDCTFYRNLPELTEYYDCSSIDRSGFTCSFSITATVAELQKRSVVMRRYAQEGEMRTLRYSKRMSLYEDCALENNLADPLDCRPGTDACADRCPFGTSICDEFGHSFGSRACIDQALSDEDNSATPSSENASDYELKLNDAIYVSRSTSYDLDHVLVGVDTYNKYFYTLTGPYDYEGDEVFGFENSFTITKKDDHDAAYSGAGGLNSYCVYNDASKTVNCEFSHKMYKKLIDRTSIRIFNTATGWQSPAKNIAHCIDGLVKPLEEYPAPLDGIEVFAHLDNAAERIVENICVAEAEAVQEEEDSGITIGRASSFSEGAVRNSHPNFVVEEEGEDPSEPVDPALTIDTDGDGHVDADDNCPLIANPDQENGDGDYKGDACDSHDGNEGSTVTQQFADLTGVDDGIPMLPGGSNLPGGNGNNNGGDSGIVTVGCSVTPSAATGNATNTCGAIMWLLGLLSTPALIIRKRITRG